MNKYDVIIIGAGIAGLAIARRLSRYRLSICVIEKEPDVAMGATKANSAIVHGGFAESHSKLKGQLCYPGRRQFARLADELDFAFKAIGSLVMTTDPDDLPKPAIADRVVEILQDDGLILSDKADYQPRRKPTIRAEKVWSMQEAARLAALPAGPERLICRCEQVPERVIVDCLHRGLPVMTVDGVKRRTRASMGICQGNFCRSRIKEVIEREYGITIDGRSDVEREGAARVTRQEFLHYLQEHRKN